MTITGKIYGINGPVIYVKGDPGFKMSEMVYVGKDRLVGEVIALSRSQTIIQVYEETTGLKPGEEVIGSGDAISVTLAPGIIGNIFDGVQRPLSEIARHSGAFIDRGISVESLDSEKKWPTHMTVKDGDAVTGGTVIATVPETHALEHRIMVPPNLSGTIKNVVPDGDYTIHQVIATLTD